MAERLTEYFECGAYTTKENVIDVSDKVKFFENGCVMGKAINRLATFEDIMEKYDIESFELLEHIIKKGKVINSVIEDFAKEEYDKMKQDRDTWKKTCELIVKELNKLNTDKCKFCCYQESNKDYGSCDCDEQFELDRTINYFYQQAKKDGNDE